MTADSQPMPISAQPSPPKAPPVQQRIGLFLLWAGLWVVLLLGVSWAGYQSGLADRNVLAATQSYQELERQYELAILDLAAQRPQTALERLVYIQTRMPDFPGLPELRNRVQQVLLQTPTATPNLLATSRPTANRTAAAMTSTPVKSLSSKDLLAEIEIAYNAQDWQRVTGLANQLYQTQPNPTDRVAAERYLFLSLRQRGMTRIMQGQLESGIADLNQAERIGMLDIDAQQHRTWAVLYAEGELYWGREWQKVIRAYQELYLIAPYFMEVAPRLRYAYVEWGRFLGQTGDYCAAAQQYAAAFGLQNDPTMQAEQLRLQELCDIGAPPPTSSVAEPTATSAVTAVPTSPAEPVPSPIP